MSIPTLMKPWWTPARHNNSSWGTSHCFRRLWLPFPRRHAGAGGSDSGESPPRPRDLVLPTVSAVKNSFLLVQSDCIHSADNRGAASRYWHPGCVDATLPPAASLLGYADLKRAEQDSLRTAMAAATIAPASPQEQETPPAVSPVLDTRMTGDIPWEDETENPTQACDQQGDPDVQNTENVLEERLAHTDFWDFVTREDILHCPASTTALVPRGAQHAIGQFSSRLAFVRTWKRPKLYLMRVKKRGSGRSSSHLMRCCSAHLVIARTFPERLS